MPLLSIVRTLVLAAVSSVAGCGLVPDHWGLGSVRDESALLARVGDRELRASQVGHLVEPGTAPEDSLRIVRNYVERWTREAAVVNHAAEDLGSDADIERLVEDYRGSLQRHRLEERLINEGVDTVVSADELLARYNAMSEGYTAAHELMRALLVKVSLRSDSLDEYEDLWREVTVETVPDQLRTLASGDAELALLNPLRWFEAAELQALLPKGAEDVSRGSRVTDAEGYRHYLRVLERVPRGDRAPLAYLEPQLRKMILEERRASFLSAYVDQVYRDAQANDEIEIYVDPE